jgi:hypothetical protein
MLDLPEQICVNDWMIYKRGASFYSQREQEKCIESMETVYTRKY